MVLTLAGDLQDLQRTLLPEISEKSSSSERRAEFCSIPLILLLGLGSHASKNALAPVEPALRALGLSPLGYAFIAAAPVLGAIVMPIIWGSWFARYERWVLVIVPSGIFMGQLCLSAGLLLRVYDSSVALVGPILALGFTLFSLSRAGMGVAQHSALAQALPVGITTGFVAVTASTHATKAACQWIVPRILDTEGLTGVQLALLVPSLLSVSAGLSLANQRKPASAELARETIETIGVRHPSHPLLPTSSSYWNMGSRSPTGKIDDGQCAVWCIGLWRAIVVGVIHSMESVMNAFLVEGGMSVDAAGSFMALLQGFAFAILFVVGPIADCIGRRMLLVVAGMLALLSSLILACGFIPLQSTAGSIAMLGLSLAGSMAPVLSLALVAANTRSPGRDFGMLDSLFSFAQCAATLCIGELRESGDFHDVLCCTTVSFGIASIISIIVAQVAKG
eukprot:TRINITY_DN2643_c0_g1_i2.p1 TRINITY_DN2643_c0_g1~~TRINITY_DN2643_c0_g1_i2.p1  ORF type:complete len:450 (-),score=60.23 TRINITY_DN2643_c0_g1_i2:116-1465(-)